MLAMNNNINISDNFDPTGIDLDRLGRIHYQAYQLVTKYLDKNGLPRIDKREILLEDYKHGGESHGGKISLSINFKEANDEKFLFRLVHEYVHELNSKPYTNAFTYENIIHNVNRFLHKASIATGFSSFLSGIAATASGFDNVPMCIVFAASTILTAASHIFEKKRLPQICGKMELRTDALAVEIIDNPETLIKAHLPIPEKLNQYLFSDSKPDFENINIYYNEILKQQPNLRKIDPEYAFSPATRIKNIINVASSN